MSEYSTDEILKKMNNDRDNKELVKICKATLKRRGYRAFFDDYVNEYVLH